MKYAFSISLLLLLVIGCASKSSISRENSVSNPTKYNGKELLSVASEIGGVVVIDDTFMASEGKVGLRAPIPYQLKEMGLTPENTIVRDYWIKKGNYYYTTYSIKPEDRWIIFDVVKWHKDVQF